MRTQRVNAPEQVIPTQLLKYSIRDTELEGHASELAVRVRGEQCV